MKKLIRFLARISGVEKDIKFEERHWIAIQIRDTSFWFTDYNKYKVIYPFLTWMAAILSNNRRISGGAAREQYDFLQNEQLVKQEGWKEIIYNSALGIMEIKNEQK
jgi:hypothetical protein